MLKKVEHIGIMVSDMDRSLAWYTGVLGLPLRARVRLNETTELAFLSLGETELELVCRKNGSTVALEGVVNHLAFTVDDVESWLERLRQHGVTLLNAEPVPVVALRARIAFFRGPDGELFELFSHGLGAE